MGILGSLTGPAAANCKIMVERISYGWRRGARPEIKRKANAYLPADVPVRFFKNSERSEISKKTIASDASYNESDLYKTKRTTLIYLISEYHAGEPYSGDYTATRRGICSRFDFRARKFRKNRPSLKSGISNGYVRYKRIGEIRFRL